MKLELFTYDSYVAHNAWYCYSDNVEVFTNTLIGLLVEFAEETGVEKGDVYWVHIKSHDRINNCIVLYAQVPQNWEATADTSIFGKSRNLNCAIGINAYLAGYGKVTNIDTSPPRAPHYLYEIINHTSNND